MLLYAQLPCQTAYQILSFTLLVLKNSNYCAPAVLSCLYPLKLAASHVTVSCKTLYSNVSSPLNLSVLTELGVFRCKQLYQLSEHPLIVYIVSYQRLFQYYYKLCTYADHLTNIPIPIPISKNV